MNALEIIEKVQALGAELYVEDSRLMVRGSGEPLPDDLRQALKQSKPELMVALGEPMDAVVASVLAEIRPSLAPSLQALPDSKLLALVNWHIFAAWSAAGRRLKDR